MSVTLVAPRAALGPLRPLLAAWEAERRTVRHVDPDHLETVTAAGEPPAGTDAVLVVAPRARSPRTLLTGPTVADSAGRQVPAATVPYVDDDALARFARAAARVHRRASRSCSVGVLGQRLARYDDLAGRVVRVLGEAARGPSPDDAVHALRWTAYDVHRADLARALARGPAVAVYVGHGRPTGWAGYAGLRAGHLVTEPDAPVGSVLSLTCRTVSRYRTGLSFGEQLVTGGVCASVVGAVGPTLHTSNARWVLRVAAGVGPHTTVGELVAQAAAADPGSPYRIVGDPTAPLRDDAAFDPGMPLHAAPADDLADDLEPELEVA